MGTGGSLRLLSPETKRGLDPFAAARNAARSIASAAALTSSRRSAVDHGLPTSESHARFFRSVSLPLGLRFARSSGLRTLKTAQVGLSSAPLTMSRFLQSFDIHSRTPIMPSLRVALAPRFSSNLLVLSCSLRFVSSASSPWLPESPLSTLNSSLSSRSSPRPISITKLHALPHFHR